MKQSRMLYKRIRRIADGIALILLLVAILFASRAL